MRKIIQLAITTIVYLNSVAETKVTDSIPVASKDVSSVSAIIGAVYGVISGPARQRRNWDRMRTLFAPDARLIATGKSPTGEIRRNTMSVEDYINNSGPLLEKDGFFEFEIGRKTEQFGNIVHAFSAYESRQNRDDEKPFMRGINSIQLWNDGNRWWVITILWQSESDSTPIPEKYIDKKKSE